MFRWDAADLERRARAARYAASQVGCLSPVYRELRDVAEELDRAIQSQQRLVRGVAASGGRVSVAVARSSDAADLDLVIRDTGVGIAPEDIPRMMEPFTQADSHLAHRREGTGLGPALARLLVELHGGNLTLHRTVGKGTRACVRFPAARVVERS